MSRAHRFMGFLSLALAGVSVLGPALTTMGVCPTRGGLLEMAATSGPGVVGRFGLIGDREPGLVGSLVGGSFAGNVRMPSSNMMVSTRHSWTMRSGDLARAS